MKYRILFSCILIVAVSYCEAQNTFPATGNVGIGTTSPASLLTVGSASVRGTLDVKGSTTDLPALSISDLRSGGKQFTFYNGLSAMGNLDIFDQVSQAFRLTIGSGGNIGIGTAYPDALLHVKSNSVIFGSNGGSFTQNIHQGGVGGKYHLALDGNTRFTLDNDGRMGLGTTAPSDKLHLYTGPSAAYGTSGGITISDSYTVGRLWDSGGGLDIGTLDLHYNGNHTMRLVANGNSYLNGGNLGIGTSSPSSMLHLYNTNNTASINIQSAASHSLLNLHPGGSNNYSYINLGDGSSYGWQLGKDIDAGGIAGVNGFYVYELTQGDHATRFAINKGGNVGIGTSVPTEKLSVNGNIKAKKVIVSQTNWPDYVFDSSYSLIPLSEVQSFIAKNKHLPEIPSAKEVEKNGINVGDNQVLLLKKIEELTLYIIEQDKVVQHILTEQAKLKSENQELQNQIKKIRSKN
jgi:hypothetical protein